jgi:hypothetical protein
MPANEEYLRSPKLMHQVFCGSALLLLIVTVWMMQADFGDEWRGYQRASFKLQATRLKARQASMEQNPAHEAKVADADARLKAADEQL